MGHLDYQSSYRRNLPHVQPRGAIMFVTFRLAGSLPGGLVNQWKQERKWLKHLEETNPTYYFQVAPEFERTWFSKFEAVLDKGSCGPLWLRDERIANQMADSLHFRDGKSYRLDSYSIMPNHVHVLFKPLPNHRN
jgi:REP-associated tyrosine transposase